MCSGRLLFFRKPSSIAFEMAWTCRVLAPVHIRKKSVNEATVLRSRTTRSVAFFSPAACAANLTAWSGSSVDVTCESGILFALPPIKLPLVEFVFSNIVNHARRRETVNCFVLAHSLSYIGRRNVVVHVAGYVNSTAIDVRGRCLGIRLAKVNNT